MSSVPYRRMELQKKDEGERERERGNRIKIADVLWWPCFGLV